MTESSMWVPTTRPMITSPDHRDSERSRDSAKASTKAELIDKQNVHIDVRYTRFDPKRIRTEPHPPETAAVIAQVANSLS
jgi:hypothetical protein